MRQGITGLNAIRFFQLRRGFGVFFLAQMNQRQVVMDICLSRRQANCLSQLDFRARQVPGFEVSQPCHVPGFWILRPATGSRGARLHRLIDLAGLQQLANLLRRGFGRARRNFLRDCGKKGYAPDKKYFDSPNHAAHPV